MSASQLLISWVFLMAYYYFVLRTYNTLGFRLFSLFFFLGIGICYSWYTDYRAFKHVQDAGLTTQAIVLRKSAKRLDVQFVDWLNKPTVQAVTGDFSAGELAGVSEGKQTLILYVPQSGTVYLADSYQRTLRNRLYFLLLPASLFLIGIVCWLSFRKYRILPHMGTIYEYLVDDVGELCSTMPVSARKKVSGIHPLLIKLVHWLRRP